jgi:transglutaminase-like putative cysteine protease
VKTIGKTHAFEDAFGNSCEMLTLTAPHKEIKIIATGTVEIAELDHGRIQDKSQLSPLTYTVPTQLTEPSEIIHEFAAKNLSTQTNTTALLDLASAIRGSVKYQTGSTSVTTSAQDALQLGMGVCQDHAHLFLACCHSIGLPARYVSGYFDSGDVAHGASHAWVDVWVEESDFSGWVSIDVTHACLQNTGYCRLAVGRDYESAAPVRGVRRGGGDESMTVNVTLRRS